MRRIGPAGGIGVAILLALSACGGTGGETLVLGTTTSVQDTGLLDEIVSGFEEESGYHVTPVVGGSGQILEQARRGELDVVLTHSPQDEAAFVAEGFGMEPLAVMENYFMVVGPPGDPAAVAGSSTLEAAFRAIAGAGSPFISRGDNSGTHRRELATWQAAEIDATSRDWYQESAVSQGQNLLVASDKGAYTLVDSSTFATLQDRVELQALVTDVRRPNVYTVTLVNPANNGHVNSEAARAFAEFITGTHAQRLIAEFGRDRYGEALFAPASADSRAAVAP